ncbi:hypothetical protein D6D28_10253 [Aureobasidium pullulans]|uniref:Uncharacterized protein n=1 Tax=Aureobasidium pullulans TaxID=5580 RepID=A0A4S8S129_AURPU|nr:hypothetical protein D6D28_10253 [Aureobasidium pullulans]
MPQWIDSWAVNCGTPIMAPNMKGRSPFKKDDSRIFLDFESANKLVKKHDISIKHEWTNPTKPANDNPHFLANRHIQHATTQRSPALARSSSSPKDSRTLRKQAHPTCDYAKISFFEPSPSFEPDPKASINKEFDRLAKQQNWHKEVAEHFAPLVMKMKPFPSFEPDPKASIKKEFDRLAKQQNWPKEMAKRFRAACYEDELAKFSAAQGLAAPLKKLQMS